MPGRPHEQALPQGLANLVAQLRASIDARHGGVDRRAAQPFHVGQGPRRPVGARQCQREVLDVEVAQTLLDVVADHPRQVDGQPLRIREHLRPGQPRLGDDVSQARLQHGGVAPTRPFPQEQLRQSWLFRTRHAPRLSSQTAGDGLSR